MKAFIVISTGGLSDGGKIGIGVGIGVGGTLALVGILFIVLCRRYDWTKRAKTGILRILLYLLIIIDVLHILNESQYLTTIIIE